MHFPETFLERRPGDRGAGRRFAFPQAITRWNEVESNADPRAFRVEQNRAVKEVRGEQDQEPFCLYVCKTGGSSLGGKLRSGSPIANTHLMPTRDQAFHLRERGSNGSVSNSIVDSGTSSIALPKNLLHAMFAEFSEAQQALLKSAVLKESYVSAAKVRREQWPDLSFVLQGEGRQDIELRVPPRDYWQLEFCLRHVHEGRPRRAAEASARALRPHGAGADWRASP